MSPNAYTFPGASKPTPAVHRHLAGPGGGSTEAGARVLSHPKHPLNSGVSVPRDLNPHVSEARVHQNANAS